MPIENHGKYIDDIKVIRSVRTGRTTGHVLIADIEVFGVLTLRGCRLVRPAAGPPFVAPPSWKTRDGYVDAATWSEHAFRDALAGVLMDAYRAAPEAEPGRAPFDIIEEFFTAFPVRELAR
jgi:DNA-binding cell septation regulator SpoVG